MPDEQPPLPTPEQLEELKKLKLDLLDPYRWQHELLMAKYHHALRNLAPGLIRAAEEHFCLRVELESANRAHCYRLEQLRAERDALQSQLDKALAALKVTRDLLDEIEQLHRHLALYQNRIVLTNNHYTRVKDGCKEATRVLEKNKCGE